MNNANYKIASATGNTTTTTTASKRRTAHVESKEPETPTVFLTFTSPSDFLSKRTRLTVRSHVTTRQHREARSRGSRSSKKFIVQNPVREDAKNQATQGATSIGSRQLDDSGRPAVGNDVGCDVLLDPSLVSTNGCRASAIGQPLDQGPASLPPLQSGPSYSSTGSNDSGSTGLSNRTNTSVSTTATSISNPLEFETMLKSVEDYMQAVFSPLWWSALGIPDQYRTIWEDCLAIYSKQEPALYFARLLFTCGHLLETGVILSGLCEMLKQKTTAAIHESLMSDRATSNGLILAIGRLAFYESMYGSQPNLAHDLHRPAQSRIVQARGGLDCLDLPEIVKAAMRWEDAVMTLQAQGEPFLASRHDVTTCDDAQALHALRLWVPEQYAALLTRGDRAGPTHALGGSSSGLKYGAE